MFRSCLHWISALFACFALAFALSSCSSKTAYADNLSCAELMDAAEDSVPVRFGYETYGSEHLQYYFSDTELPDDHCLRYSALSEDINEIGIFHTNGKEDRKAVQQLCQSYLKELKEEKSAFIAGYAPEELPKLEYAEVRCFGNYTVYAIASESEREKIFDTIEAKLTEQP